MLRIGSRSGVMKMESPCQSSRSALAPGAMRPRSSRPSAFAPAEGGGVEDIGGGGDLGLAVDDLADHRGVAQPLDHALGAGVGAEGHVHAARQVAGEALHGDAAAGEDPDAVGDVRAGVGQDADVVARPVRPTPPAQR